MFRNTFQSGFLSILYAIGSKPLQIWRKNINNGYVKRITDFEMQSSVIEICGANVSTCFLTCPSNPKQTLGVKMPFLVLLIKYLKKYFTFEVQVIDDKNVKRRFRASNYQSNTRVKPFICTIPMKLDEGWNQIHFNLTDFTRRAYGTNYLETLRVQIHANCRIRRIYFTDQLLSSKSIPAEYRAFNNANDDNAEEQYQNQLNNEQNPNMVQGEGEEEYHEYEQQEVHQVEQHVEGQVEVEHEQEQGNAEEGNAEEHEKEQGNAEEGNAEEHEQEQENGEEQNPQEQPAGEEQNAEGEQPNPGEENQQEENDNNQAEQEQPKEEAGNDNVENAGEEAPQEPPTEQ